MRIVLMPDENDEAIARGGWLSALIVARELDIPISSVPAWARAREVRAEWVGGEWRYSAEDCEVARSGINPALVHRLQEAEVRGMWSVIGGSPAPVEGPRGPAGEDFLSRYGGKG